jgi:hypothetical protein
VEANHVVGRFDRGSYVTTAGYDIRVTERCLREDLGVDPARPLEAASKVEIIKAVCHKHELDPSSPGTVGPAAGKRTLGVLRQGEDHRGAVWYESDDSVLWLCAYSIHRSGDPDDAFPYFDELRAGGRIYPTAADRENLNRDRAKRLVDDIPAEARRLRAAATELAGSAAIGRLGAVRVRVVVIEADGLREVHVAVAMNTADLDQWLAILRAVCPEIDDFNEWRYEPALPTGPLDTSLGEIAYSCLLP